MTLHRLNIMRTVLFGGAMTKAKPVLIFLAVLVCAAFSRWAQSDDEAYFKNSSFNNPSREEITTCLSEVKNDHASRYPVVRTKDDKIWAAWEASARENPRKAYKLTLHKPERDKVLAAENDPYFFAMSDIVGGIRIDKSRADLIRSIKARKADLKSDKPHLVERRTQTRAELCLSQARLSRLDGKPMAKTESLSSDVSGGRTPTPGSPAITSRNAGATGPGAAEQRANPPGANSVSPLTSANQSSAQAGSAALSSKQGSSTPGNPDYQPTRPSAASEKAAGASVCKAEVDAVIRGNDRDKLRGYEPGGEYYGKPNQYAEAVFRLLFENAYGASGFNDVGTLRRFAQERLAWAKDNNSLGDSHLLARCVALARLSRLDGKPMAKTESLSSDVSGGRTPTPGSPAITSRNAGATSPGAAGANPASARRPANTSSATDSTNSGVRDFPEPDSNECLQVVENTRGKQCGDPSSAAVRVKNICPQSIKMHLCVWDSRRNRWQCGSSTGRAGEKNLDSVLQYSCGSDGRYIYAGCSEQSYTGRFRNGNCGGNPNTNGKHSFISH